MSILDFEISEIKDKVINHDIKISEVLDEVFFNIDLYEDEHRCYIKLDKDKAYKRAAELQQTCNSEINSCDLGLFGIPVAVKDNICTKGIATTCGSNMLNNFVPEYSATAYSNMINSGGILTGKTNMDEFAMGSTSENDIYGSVINPYNKDCVAGGSSGGSAVAVALGECVVALGSDTGGSVRLPASYCGVYGLKPTYGSVSRFGLVEYASSMEQIGIFTRYAKDMRDVLDCISGYDKNDGTSIKRNYLFKKDLLDNVKGMKIGIPTEFFYDGLDNEVFNRVIKAADILKSKGAIVSECSLSFVNYAVPTYYILASSEASSNLMRYDGVKYGYRDVEAKNISEMYVNSRTKGFGFETKKRILLGTFTLSSGFYEDYYIKAAKVRRLIKNQIDNLFKEYDLIFGPVSPVTAPKLGASKLNPMQTYLQDLYTVIANLAGNPAVSVPIGFSESGMPIGAHIMAGNFQEDKLIQAAYTIEKAIGGK